MNNLRRHIMMQQSGSIAPIGIRGDGTHGVLIFENPNNYPLEFWAHIYVEYSSGSSSSRQTTNHYGDNAYPTSSTFKVAGTEIACLCPFSNSFDESVFSVLYGVWGWTNIHVVVKYGEDVYAHQIITTGNKVRIESLDELGNVIQSSSEMPNIYNPWSNISIGFGKYITKHLKLYNAIANDDYSAHQLLFDLVPDIQNGIVGYRDLVGGEFYGSEYFTAVS